MFDQAQLLQVTLGKLFRPICHCYQAVEFGTSEGTAALCSWERNRTTVGLPIHRPCVTCSENCPPTDWMA